MKPIHRFNESSDSYDFIIRVTVYDADDDISYQFDVNFSKIRSLDKYQLYKYSTQNNNDTEDDRERTAINFGLEEYMEYYYDGLDNFSFELEDEHGNVIDDIGLYNSARLYNL
jgi:hypothetical protein